MRPFWQWRYKVSVSLLAAVCVLAVPAETGYTDLSPVDWPAIGKECRPWTYWWWLGSAVSREELTRHLTEYSRIGLGGVHIVPIYGAKGYEERYIGYLSPQWMEMLAHTISEAERLGLGVDMTTGTGWPFGGPWVKQKHSASKLLVEAWSLSGGSRLSHAVRSSEQPEAVLQVLMAFSEAGDRVDLTKQINKSGYLDWKAPPGRWDLYALFQGWTKQQVKRAAPGGEGNVIDYFSTAALSSYLSRFDEAFADYRGRPPRAFYNDSYEVFGANWTADLLDEFARRRGYDLRREIPALLGKDDQERVARVRCDYRETVHELLLERFTRPWVEWCRQKGSLARSQAHGSPGNLIDLYGAADVPETEGFGPAGAEILVSKFASSAAHLYGRPFTSSESCTWLGEHFQVSLADAKSAVDQLFLAGINHIFYHGMPFSPSDAPYPGWLFYASTHFGLTNTFQKDLPELNYYIARCQSFLQAGQPDSDLLLYFPIYDLWSKEHGSKNMLQYLQVHNSGDWLKENLKPTYLAAKSMWEKGYTFDYISDNILWTNTSATRAGISIGSLKYHALVIAACELMPARTLESILNLTREGATIIVLGELPRDVPGLGRLKTRREKFKRALATINFHAPGVGRVKEAKIGAGRILLADQLESLLAAAGVRRERMVDDGLSFVRRAHRYGYDYFIVNTGDDPFDGWTPVTCEAQSAVIFDPARGLKGSAAVREATGAEIYVRLQLQPGESCILRALRHHAQVEAWEYLREARPTHSIRGKWRIEFIDGGPSIPEPFETDRLQSWTEYGIGAARAFSGSVRYAISFQRPSVEADEWMLDLGRVCESARVTINGTYVGAVWYPPYRLRVGAALRNAVNNMEVEVTNLMANRIAYMDRKGIPWRNFFFVNIRYRPFDASSWDPLPSGLLGPVKLIPCETWTAADLDES